MTIKTKTIIYGFTSAFDITGSCYKISRKKTMDKLNSRTSLRDKVHPIRKATMLIGDAFKNQDSLIHEKK